jgi:hypothetical protein
VIDPYAHTEPPADPTATRARIVGVAAALLLVIGLVAVAIGKSPNVDTAASAVDRLASAPDAARDGGTARMTITVTAGDAAAMSTTGTGLVDFRSGDSELTMTVMGNELSTKVVDGAFYMKMPVMLASPKPWIKIDIPGGVPQVGAARSAADYLEVLRGAGDVREVGREEINGEPATHYAVVVDVTRALDQLPESQREELARTFGTVPDLGDLPMDVWLSDDGLPVRTEMVSPAGPVRTTTRVDLSDFGVDVDIQPPPADQVVDVHDVNELQQLFTGTSAPAA